jgi:hypothetical protein
MECGLLFLRIRSGRIGFFKFILEGYDGLALLSTVDSKIGLVRLAVPLSRYTELMLLLENLSCDLRLLGSAQHE